MPLSHQHNKVLYFSPTIAKAFSLLLCRFNLEGNYLRVTQQNPRTGGVWVATELFLTQKKLKAGEGAEGIITLTETLIAAGDQKA